MAARAGRAAIHLNFLHADRLSPLSIPNLVGPYFGARAEAAGWLTPGEAAPGPQETSDTARPGRFVRIAAGSDDAERGIGIPKRRRREWTSMNERKNNDRAKRALPRPLQVLILTVPTVGVGLAVGGVLVGGQIIGHSEAAAAQPTQAPTPGVFKPAKDQWAGIKVSAVETMTFRIEEVTAGKIVITMIARRRCSRPIRGASPASSPSLAEFWRRARTWRMLYHRARPVRRTVVPGGWSGIARASTRRLSRRGLSPMSHDAGDRGLA